MKEWEYSRDHLSYQGVILTVIVTATVLCVAVIRCVLPRLLAAKPFACISVLHGAVMIPINQMLCDRFKKVVLQINH